MWAVDIMRVSCISDAVAISEPWTAWLSHNNEMLIPAAYPLNWTRSREIWSEVYHTESEWITRTTQCHGWWTGTASKESPREFDVERRSLDMHLERYRKSKAQTISYKLEQIWAIMDTCNAKTKLAAVATLNSLPVSGGMTRIKWGKHKGTSRTRPPVTRWKKDEKWLYDHI